jgi:hypothetical protein
MAAAIHEPALCKSSAMPVTYDAASACAPGFKAGSSAQIAVNGQIASATITAADFTYSAASISGYTTSANLPHIADRLAASIGCAASRVSATIVVCIIAAIVICIVSAAIVVRIIAAIIIGVAVPSSVIRVVI